MGGWWSPRVVALVQRPKTRNLGFDSIPSNCQLVHFSLFSLGLPIAHAKCCAVTYFTANHQFSAINVESVCLLRSSRRIEMCL